MLYAAARILAMSSIERVVTKKRLADADAPWVYWLARPAEERIDAVEQIRREHHGWTNGTEPRLQRVFKIIRRP